MVFLFLAACSGLGSDGDKFFSSDGRYTPPEWGADGSSDTAGDTGDDTAAGGDPGAPVLTDITGVWDDYKDQGMVLLVTASYTDEGDDVDGGQCYIDAFYGEESTNFDGSVGTEPTDACIAAGDQFLFALAGLDTAVDTRVDFQVADASRNVSELYSVAVAAE